MIVHYALELGFSDGETFASLVSSIDIITFMIENASMITKDKILLASKHEIFLPIYLKANVDSALSEEEYLGKVIELMEQNNILFLVPWL